jgi:hypothetical protein
LLDQKRCLPAAVKFIKNQKGEDEELKAKAVDGYAVRACGGDGDGDDMYWVSRSVDTFSGMEKKLLGTDFEWANDVYFEIGLESKSDDGPELVSQIFRDNGEKKHRLLNQSVPLPSVGCLDWVMKEFFSKTSHLGVWQFVNYMEMKVTNEVLYEAFYSTPQPLNESWAKRAAQQVNLLIFPFFFNCRKRSETVANGYGNVY